MCAVAPSNSPGQEGWGFPCDSPSYTGSPASSMFFSGRVVQRWPSRGSKQQQWALLLPWNKLLSLPLLAFSYIFPVTPFLRGTTLHPCPTPNNWFSGDKTVTRPVPCGSTWKVGCSSQLLFVSRSNAILLLVFLFLVFFFWVVGEGQRPGDGLWDRQRCFLFCCCLHPPLPYMHFL